MTLDLQAYEVSLRNVDGPLPATAVRAHALNGLFHKVLGERFPDLVNRWHVEGGAKPFSLSPMFGDEHFYGFRVGALTADVAERVVDVWGGLAARRTIRRLGSADVQVTRIQPARVPVLSYEQLWEQAPIAHGVLMAFDTPLRVKSFNRSGLLPTPQAVWQSYVSRWQAFAPARLALPPEFLRWVGTQVQATALALQTCFAYVERAVEWKGVIGEVEYQAYTDARDLPVTRAPDYLRAWQALAWLADFSGTGEKTTMGMGRTRRVKAFGHHRVEEAEEGAEAPA